MKTKNYLHDKILLERVHDGLQNRVKRKDSLLERVLVLPERVLHDHERVPVMGYIIE